MSQGQATSGSRGSYGAGRRMAALCAVLMGVFALMTVLVLAGSGGKTRLEGSVGYPEAGPLPDLVAPGGTPTTGAHGANHITPAKTGAAGSLETVGGGTATFAGATSISGSGGSTSAGSSGTSNGTSGAGKSSGGKTSTGKGGSVQAGGGKTTGSGGKAGGSGGGKGSGGGTTPGKTGSGGSGGSHPGGSTGGSGGSSGSHPGGSTGGPTGGHTRTNADRAEFLKRLEQQLVAWRAQLAEREREYAQRLAQQQSHNYQHDYPRYTPYAPRDTHASYPSPPGHAYGRQDSHDSHGRHGH